MRRTHHPLIKPAHNVFKTFDAMPWLPGAREFVGRRHELDPIESGDALHVVAVGPRLATPSDA
jgi:hypothetical protein